MTTPAALLRLRPLGAFQATTGRQLQIPVTRSFGSSVSGATTKWGGAFELGHSIHPSGCYHRRLHRLNTISARFLSSTPSNPSSNGSGNPLDQFRDPVDRETRSRETVGRSWSAKELRRKSYQDLHKLWYVLYKERNMLLTEQQLSRRRQLIFPQPDRLYKVQKSMGAIKQVLGERKQEKVAAHLAASQMEVGMMAESETLMHVEEEDGVEVVTAVMGEKQK